MRIIVLLLTSMLLLSCGGDADCEAFDLTGGWTESERSTLTLTQTCEGEVTGRWTQRDMNGMISSERDISGTVDGTRFTFVANCVDQSCTYPQLDADGTDTGATIVEDGARIMGQFSAPGRANGMFDFKRD